MTTTIVNQRGGTCAECTSYVGPGDGTATKTASGWTVRCAEHPPSHSAPGRQRSSDDQEQAAEVHYRGSRAEVTALVEALQTTPHITVLTVSDLYERPADPGRYGVYVRARVDARLLTVIEREAGER